MFDFDELDASEAPFPQPESGASMAEEGCSQRPAAGSDEQEGALRDTPEPCGSGNDFSAPGGVPAENAAIERGAGYAGYLDADLATPLSEIANLVRVLDEDPSCEVVFGARVQLLGRRIVRSRRRHYLGRVFATVASETLGLPVYDTQCGAKLLRATPRTRALFESAFHAGWTFDVELLARWLRDRRAEGVPEPERGLVEVPLQVWRHVPGSKVRATDLPRALLELWWIRREYGTGAADRAERKDA